MTSSNVGDFQILIGLVTDGKDVYMDVHTYVKGLDNSIELLRCSDGKYAWEAK
jgi:hypothetical protein